MEQEKERVRPVELRLAPDSGASGSPFKRPNRASVTAVECAGLALSDDAVRMANRIRRLLTEAEQLVVILGIDAGDDTAGLCVDVALAMSRIDESRVLLIDANAAAPRVHELLGFPAAPGLCELIEGRAEFEDVARATDLPNLDVLPIGASSGLAASLFASSHLARIVRSMRGSYRYIFADAGTQRAPEAMVLAGLGDALVIALAAGRWRRADLQDFKREISVLNARLLGAVLTDPQE